VLIVNAYCHLFFSAAKQELDYVVGFAARALTQCGSNDNGSGCGPNVQAGRFSN
jgi:hypothetical protein